MRRLLDKSGFLKFLASGAMNTLASYVLYLVLLSFLPYRWSYTISYLLGIALAYVLYRYFVFGRAARSYGVLWVVLIYLLQYLLGLGLVSFWVQLLGGTDIWAPVFAAAVSMPIAYLLNRWVFRSHNKSSDAPVGS